MGCTLVHCEQAQPQHFTRADLFYWFVGELWAGFFGGHMDSRISQSTMFLIFGSVYNGVLSLPQKLTSQLLGSAVENPKGGNIGLVHLWAAECKI